VLDDQLQHHKKKLNALKHLTSGRKIVQFVDSRASHTLADFGWLSISLVAEVN